MTHCFPESNCMEFCKKLCKKKQFDFQINQFYGQASNPLHRGAFFQFTFRWIYYCGSDKSTGNETDKTHVCALSYWIISNLSKEWLDHKTVGQSTVLKIVGVLSFLVDPFFSNWVEKYTTHLCVGHQRLFTFYNGQILAPELKNAFKKHFYVLPPIGLGK